MKNAVVVLGIAAFIPFIFTKIAMGVSGRFFEISYLLICVSGGFAWVGLLAYLSHGLTPIQQPKLARMLPLAIFAFSFPADIILLVIASWRGGAGGERF